MRSKATPIRLRYKYNIYLIDIQRYKRYFQNKHSTSVNGVLRLLKKVLILWGFFTSNINETFLGIKCLAFSHSL